MIAAINRVAAILLISLVRIYQVAIAPVMPAVCRFHPSCSHYFIEAVRLYGPWKGAGKGLNRLWRCRPGCPGGWDPP